MCQSSIKFIAFDFNPTLFLTLLDSYQTQYSHSFIDISAKNNLSNETFQLKISYLSQERALDTYWYVGTLEGLGFLMLKIHLSIKKQAE